MKQFTGGWKNQGGWAWVAPAITAAASLIGGKMSAKGQADANQQNIQLSREQMAFQERMSNSAYQRSATDMEKAGLNRILAANSPASTPSGSLATVGNEGAPMGEALSSAAQNAMQARQTAANIANVKEDTKVKTEQQDQIKAQAAANRAAAERDAATAHNLRNVGDVSDRGLEFLEATKPGTDYIFKGGLGRDLGKKIHEGKKLVEEGIKHFYGEYERENKRQSDLQRLERVKKLMLEAERKKR